jgi:hypothetical protein
MSTPLVGQTRTNNGKAIAVTQNEFPRAFVSIR